MKIIIGLLMFLGLSVSVSAQKTFELKDASKYFDIKISVAKCDEFGCSGEASFTFYKKGTTKAYQVINVDDTSIDMSGSIKPTVNETMLYDKQSVLNIGDYNFDGMEDVAICDGLNGSYGMPSYQIYLSSKSAGKFVYNKDLSVELGQSLGMFEVDKKKKVLRTFNKSGCCFHTTEEYSVVNNRPKLVFSMEEDATIKDEKKVKLTTKTLVKGKWQTKVKYVKREE